MRLVTFVSNERSLLSAGVLELLSNGSHSHRDLQQTVANTSVSRGSTVEILTNGCEIRLADNELLLSCMRCATHL